MTLDAPVGKTTLHQQVNEFAIIIAAIAGSIGILTFIYWIAYVK